MGYYSKAALVILEDRSTRRWMVPSGRWIQQEVDDLVYQIVSESRTLPQLQIPGKSQAAINNRRRRLKITGRLEHVFVGRKLKPWTIRELKHLRSLTIDYGFSAEFIAQLQLIPGRSKHAVSKMMGRVGLGNPVVKERSRRPTASSPADAWSSRPGGTISGILYA